MAVTGFTFTGGAHVQALFNAMPLKIQKKLLRHAFRAGAKLVKQSAQQRVLVDSGALRDTLKIKAMKRSRTKIGILVLTPTRQELAEAQPSFTKSAHVLEDKGYYPAAVEFGTQKMPPRPFLRPALKDNESDVRYLIATDIQAAIDDKGSGE